MKNKRKLRKEALVLPVGSESSSGIIHPRNFPKDPPMMFACCNHPMKYTAKPSAKQS